MKKRVLIISHLAYPIFKENTGIIHGGAQLALANVAKYLDKNRYEIHFIVGNFGQTKKEITKDGIILYRGPKIKKMGIIGAFLNFLILLNLIRKIKPQVIISSSAGWLTIELIIIKILIGAKYIFRSSHKNNICGNTDKMNYGWLYRKLINQIDFFILQNEEDIKIFKNTYDYRGNEICIKNSQNIPKNMPFLYNERKYILWVGRSESIKRPELFLELAKIIPDRKFIMIMPKTDNKIFSEIKNRAFQIKNLRIIEGVERTEIDDYFKRATYFVNTSEGEGFPNTIVEAMKYGTPIISFFLDYDGILKNNNLGLIAGGKVEKIKKFIENIYEERWNELSFNCYQFAKKNFDIKQNIKKWENIIEKC